MDGTVAGATLARNVFLNAGGHAMPLLLAVVTMPALVRHLGVDRLGILSLAWVVLGTAAVFDLGLGRATTKLVAEAVARGRRQQVQPVVWTAVGAQGAAGIVVALVLAAVTPLLVERALAMPAALVAETESAFYVVAAAVPFAMAANSLLGILEAGQRFDLVAAVRMPSAAATFLIPLAGAIGGLGLPGILAALLAARAAAVVVAFVLAARVFPEIRSPTWFSATAMARLWAFGGWVAASAALGPLIRYVDRYVIASVLSVSAAAYYSAPFDLVERLWVIPASVVGPLFPAFSALSATGDAPRVRALLLASAKYVVLAVAPVALALGLLADRILDAWLGAAFAEHATLALRILGVAALVGAVTPIAGAVVEGHGRPDLIARLYAVYLPLNAVITWAAVRALGLPGAAGVFAIRALADAVLVFVFAARVVGFPLESVARGLARPAVVVVVVAGAATVAAGLGAPGVSAPVATAVVVVVALLAWRCGLDDTDRVLIRSLLGRASP